MIRTIILELTNYCNGSCLTCLNRFMSRKRGFMDSNLFYLLIDKIVDGQLCDTVNLFGIGESFLHPFHKEMFDYAIPKFNSVGIKSNLISNGGLIDEIPEGLTTMGISFNAGRKETYERIMGISFDKTVANIRRLIDEGQHKRTDLAINMLVFEDNKDEMEEVKRLFPELPVRYAFKYENQCGSIEDKTLSEYKTTERFPCRYVLEDVNVAWNGDVLLCPHSQTDEIVYGNVKDQSIMEIWNSSSRLCILNEHLRNVFTGICEKCNYNVRFDHSKFIYYQPIESN